MAKHFAGLDVGDQSTAVCVLSGRGKVLLETSVATTPSAIAISLKPFKRLLSAVGQETGTKCRWLHIELLKRDFPMVCLDARHVKAALSAKANKTDRNDARGIAMLLRRGVYTTAHIKSDEAVRIRLLLSTRRTLQRKGLDLQGSTRMALKTFGAQIETKRRRVVVKQQHGAADDMLSQLVQVMTRASDELMTEVAILDKLISSMAIDDPVCSRLMTIPGVGPITALAFRAGVDDPRRFKSSRMVPAHFGLTPRLFQSGQTRISGHISLKGDKTVRAALYSAASSLLNTSNSQWSLRRWGLHLAETKGFKVAAVACARRLAIVMHRIWIEGDEFRLREAASGSRRQSPAKRANKKSRSRQPQRIQRDLRRT